MIAEALRAYSGRRVFVTGHTGFKGAWLCSWLDRLGASTVGYALPAERQSLFNQGRVADRMESLEGDVRDLDKLRDAIAETQPEILFHMAAQSLVVAFENAGKLDKDKAARLHAKLDALYETVKDENNYAMTRFDGALKDLRAAAP